MTVEAPLMRLAAPKAGLSIQQIAGRWANPVQDAYQGVMAIADEAIRSHAAEDVLNILGSGVPRDDLTPEVLLELAAATSVSIVVLGLIHAPHLTSFAEACEWFFGEAEGPMPFSGWARQVDEQAQPLRGLNWDIRCVEILPQVFEVFVTGPVGTSRSAAPGRRNDRHKKRKSGAFYTPLDVADYLADRTIGDWLERHAAGAGPALPTCVDPACGTGVFLLAALDCLSSRVGPAPTLEEAARRVRRMLFGFDLNIRATQAAGFVLLSRCLADSARTSDISPQQALAEFAGNLRSLDATAVRAGTGDEARLCQTGVTRQQYVMSGMGAQSRTYTIESLTGGARDRFDVLLGNPPFSVRDASGKRSAAYQPFVEMMWHLTESDGSAGMVLPLSIAYNQSHRDTHLRSRMQDVRGEWQFAFFDRTPDSLFGDDVKTRNAIAFLRRHENGSGLSTTSFLRWNSRQRPELFQDISFEPVGWELAQRGVPKLGSREQVGAYRTLLDITERVRDVQCGPRTSGRPTSEAPRHALMFSSTAYNWLPVFPVHWLHAAGHDEGIRSDTWSREFADTETAAVAFALLQSRLTYWLWRVEGDGFHVTRWFVDSLPYGPLRSDTDARKRLATLARRLWAEMLERPIRSVNQGRVSLSYSPNESYETLDSIDGELCALFDLPVQFPAFLAHFLDETIAAGREGDPGASD